jgi:hypothetical protein
MKVYWQYTCDENHHWGYLKEEHLLEEIEERCPFGHIALILKKCPPIDEVQLTIRPAGYISDEITRSVHHDKWYKLVVTDRVGGEEEFVSSQNYSWDDAIKLATRFRQLTKAKAWKLWESIQP